MRVTMKRQFKFSNNGEVISKNAESDKSESIYDLIPFLITEKPSLENLKLGESIHYPFINTSCAEHSGIFNFTISSTVYGKEFLLECDPVSDFEKIQRLTQQRNEALIALEKVNYQKSQSNECDHEKQELKSLNEKLHKQKKVYSQMLSIVSHDLGGSISSINTMLSMLMHKKITKKDFYSMLPTMVQRTSNTDSLTKELLAWSKSQLDSDSQQLEKISLASILNEVINQQETELKNKKIIIENYVKNNISIYSNPDFIKFVLRNVLTNAIKYTNENGKVRFKSSNVNGDLKISIIDNGIGIPSEKLKEMQQGLIQESRLGTSKEKGNGIGMMLVNDLVKQNRGHIDILSKENFGTEVDIIIPIK